MSKRTVILFDGQCNLCNWAVNFVLDKDRREFFLFSPMQSDRGREILTQLGFTNKAVETIIYLLENKKTYSKSTAVLLILRQLPFPWKLSFAFIVVPIFLRDFIYDVVAKHRYVWFGKKNSCRIPSESEKSRFLI